MTAALLKMMMITTDGDDGYPYYLDFRNVPTTSENYRRCADDLRKMPKVFRQLPKVAKDVPMHDYTSCIGVQFVKLKYKELSVCKCIELALKHAICTVYF